MIRVEIEMEIEAPPETVFDLLADHTKHPLWDPNMIDGTLDEDGPIVAGSKGKTVAKFRKGTVESDIYYDAYDRPTYVSGGTAGGMVTGTMACEFAPTEEWTKIKWRMAMQFNGLMRLMQPFLKSTAIKQRRETLEALREYVAQNR